MDSIHRSILIAVVAAAVCLGATEPLHAKEIVVRIGWNEARTTMSHADLFRRIRVWKKADRSRPVKGMLLAATDTGLRLARGKSEVFIDRGEIHSLRLFPRKARGRKNRNIATVAAVPAAFGTLLGVWAVSCRLMTCNESGGGTELLTIPASVAVPVLIYKRAWKADRGSVLIILAGQQP